jgi:septal ring factor EnvC (AmiA/AmiB activator)
VNSGAYRVLAGVLISPALLGLIACGDDSAGSEAQGGGATAICRDVEFIRSSLDRLGLAVADRDSAALNDAQGDLRAYADSLAFSIDDAGRDDLEQEVSMLVTDYRELQRALAQPDLNLQEIQQQIDDIEATLTTIEGAAGCG